MISSYSDSENIDGITISDVSRYLDSDNKEDYHYQWS